MALLESTKLERLRVIRDAKFVDRFEKATATLTLTPGVSESVTGGASPSSSVVLTPGVSEATTEKRVGQLIDDFEDGDLSEYQGDVSNPENTVQGNVVDDGTFALQMDTVGLGSSTDRIIYSTSGLDIYPKQSDAWQVSVYLTDTEAHSAHLFGVQGQSDFYFVRYSAFADDFEVGKVDSGTETVFETATATAGFDRWLTYEVRWFGDGTIEADLIDENGTVLTTVSGSDSTWTSGGVGFAEAADFET